MVSERMNENSSSRKDVQVGDCEATSRFTPESRESDTVAGIEIYYTFGIALEGSFRFVPENNNPGEITSHL